MNKEIDQTKKLLITDEKSLNDVQFIEKLEKEKTGIKLYYYMWLSRLFIFFAVVFLAVFMSSSLTLFKLAPKVFVEPLMIVGQDNSDDIVRTEALVTDMVSKDKMLELFMKQYIIVRNTVVPDEQEMMTRWAPGGMMHFLSSNEIYYEFANNIESKIDNFVSSGISRSVEIESIGKVGGDKSPIWKVNFITYDLSLNNKDEKTGAMKLTKAHWTASISARFYPQRIFMSRRLINPLGFTVLDYSQARVNVF